jgi:hypothetical protein
VRPDDKKAPEPTFVIDGSDLEKTVIGGHWECPKGDLRISVDFINNTRLERPTCDSGSE